MHTPFLPTLPQSDAELQAEYKHHHRNVWPEMQQALQRCGWHNYSLFMKKDGTLFGYFESDQSLDECIKGALDAARFPSHGRPSLYICLCRWCRELSLLSLSR